MDSIYGVQIKLKTTQRSFDFLFCNTLINRYSSFTSIDVVCFEYSSFNDDYDEKFDQFMEIDYEESDDEYDNNFKYSYDDTKDLFPILGYNNEVQLYFVSPDDTTDFSFSNKNWDIAIYESEDPIVELFGDKNLIQDVLVELDYQDFREISYPGGIKDLLNIEV